MKREIKVEIKLGGLPKSPNYDELAKALEEEIIAAVARALHSTYPYATKGKTWAVHVPSF